MKFNKKIAKDLAVISLSTLNAVGAGYAVDKALSRLSLGHDVEIILDSDGNAEEVIFVEKTPKKVLLTAARKTLSVTSGVVMAGKTAYLVDGIFRMFDSASAK